MYRTLATLILSATLLTACGREQPAPPPPADVELPATSPPDSALPQPNYDIPMRNFADLEIGPYHVQPMFEEEIENGHYNIKVHGDEVKAVRIWVGPEDASGVMVVKTEIENDYNHGHVEVPTPVPADAVLWIEIENPDGEIFKGSTPLKAAS
jgi:hypothetical protein